MDNIKNFIKNNKGIVIIFILTITAAISLFIYKQVKTDENYEKNLTESEATDVEYVKKNYQVNEYRNVSIDLIDILNEYYRDYINKLSNSPEEAYQMLTSESKEDFGNSYEEFNKYVKKINTLRLSTSKVSEYRTNKGRIKSYDIIDTEGNKFTFYEKSVWDLEVTFRGRQ